MTALTNSHIFVGNSSNVATDVAMSGDVTINNTGATTIKTNVALAGNPTTTTQSSGNNSTKIATTAYVDGAVSSGLGARPACRVATTAEFNNVIYSNGSSGVGATLTNNSTQVALSIDGVSLSVNDRVLVRSQISFSNYNGIYTVTTVGSGSTNWVLTRATDFNTASPTGVVEGAYTVVEEGKKNAATLWIETGRGPFTIGTTAITFTGPSLGGLTDVVTDYVNNSMYVGANSGLLCTGIDNTALGATALAFCTTGDENTAIGLAALEHLTTGSGNTAIGLIVGNTLIIGSDNILIGSSADVPTSSTSYYLNIGNVITGNMNGTATLNIAGNPTTTTQSPGDDSTKIATTAYVDNAISTPHLIVSSFGITIDGGGAVPGTGSKGFITIPYAGTITNWYLAADQAGSCVIDVKRSGSSIIGTGNKPTLSSTQTGNAAVSGWTSTTITAGDIIEFALSSVSTITRVNLVIKLNRT